MLKEHILRLYRALSVVVILALVLSTASPLISYAEENGTTTPDTTQEEQGDENTEDTEENDDVDNRIENRGGTDTEEEGEEDTEGEEELVFSVTGEENNEEENQEEDQNEETGEGAGTTTQTTTENTETEEDESGENEQATSTDETSGGGTAEDDSEESDENTPSVVTDEDEYDTSSSSSASSAVVDPEESNNDNSDFEDINPENDAILDSGLPVEDVSATTTEHAASEPENVLATDEDNTGNKQGGTVLTGNAESRVSTENILNITRSSIDGPGETNATLIKSETDNFGDLTNESEADAATGENEAIGGTGDATVLTGNAHASAEVFNVVNTNFFNSDGLILFLNPNNGDGLDLRQTDFSYFFDNGAGASPTQFGCTVLTCLNSSALSVLNKNEAVVDNTVTVRADTGNNMASTTESGMVDIDTGDAYAAANVLNLVNTNFINSSYFLAAFNNFGDLNDDIVLPDEDFFDDLLSEGGSIPDLNSSSYVVNNTNTENFFGTTTANAVTGENVATTTGEGHGEIFTGKANSSADSYTLANQTRVGGSSVYFVFKVWGDWSGEIKGLPRGMSWRQTPYGIEVYSTGSGPSRGDNMGEYNSSFFLASSTNEALVHTNVDVLATTGSNEALSEDGAGAIRTGDAYAQASVVNMVNTNIVGRNWMFATFNIFGDWSGDISFGGHSPDLNLGATLDASEPIAPDTDVSYEFTVTNNGVIAANGVTLSTSYNKNLLTLNTGDTGGITTSDGMRFNVGTLQPGESSIISVTGHVDGTDLPADSTVSLPLTATVSSNLRDQSDGDNTQILTITIVTEPEVGDSNTGDDAGDGSTDEGEDSTNDDEEDPRDRDDDREGSSSSGGSGGSSGAGGSSGGGGGGASSGGTGGASSGSGGSSGGGGGGGGIIAGGGGGGIASVDSRGSWTPDPLVTMTKKASALNTVAPGIVDYEVIVQNDKTAGPVHNSILTDIMFDPLGEIMYERSWPLGALEPGDEIQLNYSVEFATSTAVGLYKNIARLTGQKNNSVAVYAVDADLVEASSTITILPNGLDADGLATSTPKVSDPTINISKYVCEPLLTKNMRPGRGNDPLDVVKLQNFLNGEVDSGLPTTGYFGPLTTAAVKKFQAKYADEVLAPWNLTEPTGLVYTTTRKKINELACNGRPVGGEGDTEKRDVGTTDRDLGSPVAVTGSRETTPAPRSSSNTASAAAASNSDSQNENENEEENQGGILGAVGSFFGLW